MTPARRQCGIATGWLYLIGLILLVGALTGLVVAWDNYTSGLIKQGFSAGVAKTGEAYAKRDNAALTAKTERITFLENQARARERADAKRNAAIAAQRETDRRDYEKQLAADIAAARAGELVLFDPYQTTAACPGIGSRGAASEANRPASERDGKAGSKLSAAFTGFLISEADRADDITRQLDQAQAVILQDRLTCNGP